MNRIKAGIFALAAGAVAALACSGPASAAPTPAAHPVIVIGMSGTAGMIRRLRANLLDELQKQYVITGRAKGLPPLKLLIKYPLRHAINPFVADIGHLLPEVISGSVIVSVVLSLPTTGPMLLGALKTQDVNLAATFLLFVAVLTVIGMLVSDLLLLLKALRQSSDPNWSGASGNCPFPVILGALGSYRRRRTGT